MMTPEKLKGFVNSSGFPLQIGIEHLVRSKNSVTRLESALQGTFVEQ